MTALGMHYYEFLTPFLALKMLKFRHMTKVDEVPLKNFHMIPERQRIPALS